MKYILHHNFAPPLPLKGKDHVPWISLRQLNDEHVHIVYGSFGIKFISLMVYCLFSTDWFGGYLKQEYCQPILFTELYRNTSTFGPGFIDYNNQFVIYLLIVIPLPNLTIQLIKYSTKLTLSGFAGREPILKQCVCVCVCAWTVSAHGGRGGQYLQRGGRQGGWLSRQRRLVSLNEGSPPQVPSPP